MLQDAHLTDIGARRKQPMPTGAAYAETPGLRHASQVNDRFGEHRGLR